MISMFSNSNVEPAFQYLHHVKVISVVNVSVLRVEVRWVSQPFCEVGWWSVRTTGVKEQKHCLGQ
jgi:hypothetical protein